MSRLFPIRFFISCAAFVVLLLVDGYVFAQTQPVVGIRRNTPTVHAFINARIVKAPGDILENSTLVIRDGLIVAVGNVPVPKDARVWDLKGLTIYPGLIDSYSDYGMPKPLRQAGQRRGTDAAPQAADAQRGATFWNSGVLAQEDAARLFLPDAGVAERLRSQGFTSALVVPARGIFKGTSAVVNLGDGTPGDLILRANVAQHVSLDVDYTSERYPNSLMGLIALVRQTLDDASWYRDAHNAYQKNPRLPRPETDETLAALRGVIDGQMPLVIETSTEWDALRAEAIAKEFKIALIVRGSGREYLRADAIAALHRTVILPLTVPKAPSVQTPEEALQVSLFDLRLWDEMPENPARLRAAGIPLAFTSSLPGDSASSFLGRLRKAVSRGLAKDDALAAMTTVPARLFGLESNLGSLVPGKIANFIVTNGDLFSERTLIRESWIDGKRYEVKPAPDIDPRGTWRLAVSGTAPSDTMLLSLKGEPDSLRGTIQMKSEIRLSRASLSGLRLFMSFPGDAFGRPGVARMTGLMRPDELDGTGEWPDGKTFGWHASRTAAYAAPPDTAQRPPVEMASFPPVVPPGEFGRKSLPEQPAVVMVRNATIWTCGPEGIIQNGDVLFQKGKVAHVGKNLSVPSGAVVIDGTGKHVTPGIIDAHSHMAGEGGLNETGFAISAEVRVGDVINPDDIDLYRNLAGGLTVAHVLHGSANPIGGQNQVIKLRWGALPEQMKFEGAPPTIKFALGENVKQSNWRTATPRYPQTRMGVEQIIRDEFKAALDYEKAWQHFKENPSEIPPRRNLQLDAVLDVLHGRSFVHCHAYRQDEILMMMRVAEEFGFRIRSFEHILEGYKVADVMAKHGAGGSTFTDWWAYKFEVYDAIPYNAALMHDQGVLVSFNSDSDELSRRLNLEAAKAVKYGGLSEEEALKFVTINPAKQLFIDKRVGSLEAGKDADFVIWSGHPLSNYTICEQTWIDGRRYFDRQEDRQLYEEAQHERAVIIQKLLKQKGSVSPVAVAGRAKQEEATDQSSLDETEEEQP